MAYRNLDCPWDPLRLEPIRDPFANLCGDHIGGRFRPFDGGPEIQMDPFGNARDFRGGLPDRMFLLGPRADIST
jgi:hypothetical protein